MDLLDLPPEMVGMVIHELVSCSSPSNVWNLRCVCHTFKITIEHEMFASRPLEKFRSQRANKFLRHNIGVYLYHRVKSPLDAHNALPAKIAQLASFLGKEMHQTSSQQTDVTHRALCESISKVVAATTIIDMLLHGTLEDIGFKADRPLRPDEKLFGAIFVAEGDLIKTLLPSVSEWTKHVLFGYPLVAAVLLDQTSSVNMILNQDRGTYVAKRRFMPLNGDSHQSHVQASVQEAIFTAIKHDSVHMVRDLTSWYSNYGKTMSKSTYNAYMEAAIRANSVAMVKQMLKVPFAKTHNTSTITAAQEDMILRLNRVKILQRLIQKGHIRPHSKWLVDAVRSNQLSMAELMVKLGVDINATYHRIASRAVSAVQVAISTQNTRALKWLLRAGANLPDKIDWRKERRTGIKINQIIRKAQRVKRATDRTNHKE